MKLYGTFSAKFHFLPNIQTSAGLFTTQTLSSYQLPQTFKTTVSITIFYSNFFSSIQTSLACYPSTISCRQTQVKFLHILEVNFRHVSNVNETFFQNDKHDCIWTNIISSWANVQTYNNFTRKNISLSIRNCLKGITSCMWHFVIY